MELKQLKTGEVFELAGHEWVLLEHDMWDDKSLAVTKECIPDMVFDENGSNDFRNSTLRKYLNNDFLEELISEGLDEDSIIYTDFDLSACEDENSYGFCRDKIGLLTIEQYRKHRDILVLGGRWWLITPISGDSENVRTVYSDGSSLFDYVYYGDFGVRPALHLKSDIIVHVTDTEINLESFSSEELLYELLRRESNSN